MRGLFWVLALFSVAVGLSLVARYDDGYVLIFIAPKRIEFSLTLFVLLIAVAFAMLYFFVRAAAYTLRLPDTVREFRATRVREKARHALFDALTSSFEGRYARAEKSAGLAYSNGGEPGLAALIAARAAHRLNQPEARDQWLARARDAAVMSDGKSLLHALLMTQAELLADERRDREVLEVLRELNRSGARHIATQRLALASMTRAGDWEDALKTARQLEDHHAIHPAVALKTREAAYAAVFDGIDAPALRERLKRVPRQDRRSAPLARIISRALIRAAMAREARDLIEEALAESWDDTLGQLYAECASGDSAANRVQLERAEMWRTSNPHEPGALLALARLCAREGLWGKAREYLEQAIAASPRREAYIELARLFDATGKQDDANRCYRLAAQAD